MIRGAEWVPPCRQPAKRIQAHEYLKATLRPRRRYPAITPESETFAPHSLTGPLDVTEVERPIVYLSCFTPDGRALIAMTTSIIVIYNYHGFDKLNKISNPLQLMSKAFTVRGTASLHESVDPTPEKNPILCFDNSKFIVVCHTREAIPGDAYPFVDCQLFDIKFKHRTHYYFIVIAIDNGDVIKEIYFPNTYLVFQNCFYIRRKWFAVLSILTQHIVIYELNEDNRSVDIVQVLGEAPGVIGIQAVDRNASPDAKDDTTSLWFNAFPSLLQQLLASIYLYFENKKDPKKFHRDQALFRSMRMIKLQFVTDDELLIRWVPMREAIPTPDGTTEAYSERESILTFYNWRTKVITKLSIWPHNELYEYVEQNENELKYAFASDRAAQFSPQNWDAKRPYTRTELQLMEKPKSVKIMEEKISKLPYSCVMNSCFSPVFDPRVYRFEPALIEQIEQNCWQPKKTPFRTTLRSDGTEAINLNLDDLPSFSQQQPIPLSAGDYSQLSSQPVYQQLQFIVHPWDSFIIGAPYRSVEGKFIFIHPRLAPLNDFVNTDILNNVQQEEDEAPLNKIENSKRRRPYQASPSSSMTTSTTTAVTGSTNANINEMHVALVGMKNSGKSALAVKYITKRFLGEYCSDLEDTYCHQDMIGGQAVMVWLMDTVDSAERDPNRYLAWADVFVVVYDVTSRLSFQVSEQILQQITNHEHSLCARDHKTILIGNKTDLDRYRQVNESDGDKIAKKYKAMFSEVSATQPHTRVATALHKPIAQLMKERTQRRSPSPSRMYSSDSEVSRRQKSGFSLIRNSTLRRSKSPKHYDGPKLQATKRTGSKLLKLFHN